MSNNGTPEDNDYTPHSWANPGFWAKTGLSVYVFLLICVIKLNINRMRSSKSAFKVNEMNSNPLVSLFYFSLVQFIFVASNTR